MTVAVEVAGSDHFPVGPGLAPTSWLPHLGLPFISQIAA